MSDEHCDPVTRDEAAAIARAGWDTWSEGLRRYILTTLREIHGDTELVVHEDELASHVSAWFAIGRPSVAEQVNREMVAEAARTGREVPTSLVPNFVQVTSTTSPDAERLARYALALPAGDERERIAHVALAIETYAQQQVEDTKRREATNVTFPLRTVKHAQEAIAGAAHLINMSADKVPLTATMMTCRDWLDKAIEELGRPDLKAGARA